MKNSKYIFLFCLGMTLFLSSCGIFNSGKKCDCPKFGENTVVPADELAEPLPTASLE